MNNNPKKISFVIPCYNMENKISRMLESLLLQTYKCFCVYIVDDGSKDSSKVVIGSYIEKFERAGIPLTYIYQDNAGVSAAINRGLQNVETRYFSIPDADDFLSSNYVEKCVNYMEKNTDCDIVFTECKVFHESNLNKSILTLSRKDEFNSPNASIFMDFIWGHDVYYCPNYFIKTQAFIKYNGSMVIDNCRHGQNYQMLLPMCLYGKIGYIKEPLYNYVIYKNSISHGHKGIDKLYRGIDAGTKTLIATIENIVDGDDKISYYKNEVLQKQAIQKAYIAAEYGNKSLFIQNYNTIRDEYVPDDLKSIYLKINRLFFLGLYSLKKKIINEIKTNQYVYKIRTLIS